MGSGNLRRDVIGKLVEALPHVTCLQNSHNHTLSHYLLDYLCRKNWKQAAPDDHGCFSWSTSLFVVFARWAVLKYNIKAQHWQTEQDPCPGLNHGKKREVRIGRPKRFIRKYGTQIVFECRSSAKRLWIAISHNRGWPWRAPPSLSISLQKLSGLGDDDHLEPSLHRLSVCKVA